MKLISYTCTSYCVQAVLREDVSGSKTSGFEVVRCKLTLFYKYWQMNEVPKYDL